MIASCATGPQPGGGAPDTASATGERAAGSAESAPAAAPEAAGPTGPLLVDITDSQGMAPPAKVVLYSSGATAPFVVYAPEGVNKVDVPVGSYTAYLHACPRGLPVMIDAINVTVEEGKTAFAVANLDAAVTHEKPLDELDKDYDLVIDALETRLGTDPADPASYPGALAAPVNDAVLGQDAGWYCGDPHIHSSHGEGTETVADIVKRAEKAGLDFAAIADRNTMDACKDPSFTSSKVVLIPAMEWGYPERGIALIYGPRTLPDPSYDPADMQAVVQRVHVQGGVFAAAHPCLPAAPWQWDVGFINAVEVWCREWNTVPPLALSMLDPAYKTEGERVTHPLAIVAATTDLSANGQAALYWNYVLQQGFKSSPIAGSLSGTSKIAVGRPVTFVYAENKSVRGILDGLRLGRVYVAAGPEGPRLEFFADVGDANGKTDNIFDVGMGGTIPMGRRSILWANVVGAQGKKIQIMSKTTPILTKVIEAENFVVEVPVEPMSPAFYWVRIISTAEPSKGKPVFSPLDVHAISSPIYAQPVFQKVGDDQALIEIPYSSEPPQLKELHERGGKKFLLDVEVFQRDGKTYVHRLEPGQRRPEGFVEVAPPAGRPNLAPQWRR